jgi:hypothetical protein
LSPSDEPKWQDFDRFVIWSSRSNHNNTGLQHVAHSLRQSNPSTEKWLPGGGRGGTTQLPNGASSTRPESSRPLINQPPPTRLRLFDMAETLTGQTLNVTLTGRCKTLENARINVHSKEISSSRRAPPSRLLPDDKRLLPSQTKRFQPQRVSREKNRAIKVTELSERLKSGPTCKSHVRRSGPIFTRQNHRPGLKSRNFNSFSLQ